jgi:uncharacterized glyoxalase superfamily protein PhnB
MTVRLNAIGIVADSIPASLDFYRLLGVDVPEAGEEPHAEAVAGGWRLMWDTRKSIIELGLGGEQPRGGQPMTLAFECDSAEELDRTFAAVTAAGHGWFREPWDAPWGQRYAVLIDPDGLHVDLYAAL